MLNVDWAPKYGIVILSPSWTIKVGGLLPSNSFQFAIAKTHSNIFNANSFLFKDKIDFQLAEYFCHSNRSQTLQNNLLNLYFLQFNNREANLLIEIWWVSAALSTEVIQTERDIILFGWHKEKIHLIVNNKPAYVAALLIHLSLLTFYYLIDIFCLFLIQHYNEWSRQFNWG